MSESHLHPFIIKDSRVLKNPGISQDHKVSRWQISQEELHVLAVAFLEVDPSIGVACNFDLIIATTSGPSIFWMNH